MEEELRIKNDPLDRNIHINFSVSKYVVMDEYKKRYNIPLDNEGIEVYRKILGSEIVKLVLDDYILNEVMEDFKRRKKKIERLR